MSRAALPTSPNLAPVLVVLALLGLVAACGGGGASAPGGTAPIGFLIAGSSPANGAIFVPLDETIFVSFTKPVNPATVGANTVRVESAGGTVISGVTSILLGSSNRTLRYTTVQALSVGQLHTCTIDPSLRSVDGEPLQGATSFTFTAIVPGSNGLPTANQMRAAAGQLNEGRQGHAATLLLDGRVLVTGGFSLGGSATDTAETFSSATEQFTTLNGRMQHARAGHTATLLTDGRVLLAGGWYEVSPGQPAVRLTAEVFDPATNSFTSVGDMTQARADHAALRLPNGTVLLTGGSDYMGGAVDLDDAELFNPALNTFSAYGPLMNAFRAAHAMADQGNGKWVVTGAYGSIKHERFDLATGLFEPLSNAASDAPRFGRAVATFASGAVTVAGGELSPNLNATVLHIHTDGTVQNTGSGMSRPRSHATATRIQADQILIVGGIDFSNGGFIESSCDVVVEGGIGGSNTFPTAARLGTGMAHHTATVLDTGDILFCGGLNENGALPNKTAAFIFEVP